MKVLVACEFSGIVREAFAKRGHDVWSCDLLPTEIQPKRPWFHITGDVLPILKQDWDLLIAFPPCTHLAVSGAKHFAKKIADGRQQEGIDFFMEFVNTDIPKWCVENPVGIMSRIYRKPNQIIQPWQFGEPFQKTTCLWTKGLSNLVPTKIVDKGEFYISPSGKKLPKWYSNGIKGQNRQTVRNRTFQGIADAMATQWS